MNPVKSGLLNENDIVKVSKFLSFVLRHRLEKIGLTVDEFSWAGVSELTPGVWDVH